MAVLNNTGEDTPPSPIKERDNRLNIFCWISPLVLIFSILLIINQKFSCISIFVENYEYVKLYNDLLYFAIINSILIFIIVLIIKHSNNLFRNWALPFFEVSDREENHKVFLIFRSIYLPVIVYLVLNLLFIFLKLPESRLFNISIFGFFGIWITFLSFVVAIKIYFEVQRTKTKTLKEYLDIATKAIEKMRYDETLVFIAPTLFVGAMEKETEKLSEEFREKLIDKASKLTNGGKIIIAILDTGLNKSSQIFTKENDEKIKNFRENTNPYFKYHNHFIKEAINNNDGANSPKTEWYSQHFEFLKNIHSTSNIEVLLLKGNSGIYKLADAIQKGYFCIANYKSGFLYFGEYVVHSLGYVPFYGSWLKDQNVMNLQKDFISELIKKHSIA